MAGFSRLKVGPDPVPATLVLEEEGSSRRVCSVGIGSLLRPFIVIGFLSGATGAFAEPVVLANDELKQTVSGSTVEIDTPLGTTVPMRFGADGLVAAEAGVLAPVLGSAKDRGRWWVDGEKLCTKWFRWFDAGVRCLTIKQDGTRIYWRKIDDGETGTGTLVAGTTSKQKQKPEVVAKAVVVPSKAPASTETPSVSNEKPPVRNEKRATRLAGPAREVPDEQPAPAAAPSPFNEAAPMVASAEAKPAAEDALEEGPTMRFGGPGLLEATSLPVVGNTVSEAKSPEQTPADKPEAKPDSPVRELPAKDDRKYSVASGTPAKKTAALQRQASLEMHAPAKRAAQKRARTGKKSRDVAAATSSSRSVALYRVTGVAGYDVLNVRRGPSEEHVQIAAIPPTGRRVEITGECREDWCPIRYGGITGWVNSYYLAEEGAREEQSSRAAVRR